MIFLFNYRQFSRCNRNSMVVGHPVIPDPTPKIYYIVLKNKFTQLQRSLDVKRICSKHVPFKSDWGLLSISESHHFYEFQIWIRRFSYQKAALHHRRPMPWTMPKLRMLPVLQHMSNETNPGCFGYIYRGWNPTQFCVDWKKHEKIKKKCGSYIWGFRSNLLRRYTPWMARAKLGILMINN